MEMLLGPFNNIPIYKKPVHYPDIIKLSHTSHIDRLQFSIHNHYAETIMAQFNSLFEYIRPIKVDKKFIHRFRHNHSLIDFIQWGRNSFYSAVIINDPDIEIQNKLSQVIEVCPMNLSQFEVAFDYLPDDKHDLHDLWRVLNDGLVLKYSRVGCYSKVQETDYIGKDGNVRKGSRGGSGVYKKQKDGRYFLRMELQFNQKYIKRKSISLPVDAGDFNLFDFVDYREPLDKARLEKLLYKRQLKAHPIEKAADVRMVRELERETIWSHVDCAFMYSPFNKDDGPTIAEQISMFKLYFQYDNVAHPIDWFFPKSGKKKLIIEDIPKGFVRRKY